MPAQGALIGNPYYIPRERVENVFVAYITRRLKVRTEQAKMVFAERLRQMRPVDRSQQITQLLSRLLDSTARSQAAHARLQQSEADRVGYKAAELGHVLRSRDAREETRTRASIAAEQTRTERSQHGAITDEFFRASDQLFRNLDREVSAGDVKRYSVTLAQINSLANKQKLSQAERATIGRMLLDRAPDDQDLRTAYNAIVNKSFTPVEGLGLDVSISVPGRDPALEGAASAALEDFELRAQRRSEGLQAGEGAAPAQQSTQPASQEDAPAQRPARTGDLGRGAGPSTQRAAPSRAPGSARSTRRTEEESRRLPTADADVATQATLDFIDQLREEHGSVRKPTGSIASQINQIVRGSDDGGPGGLQGALIALGRRDPERVAARRTARGKRQVARAKQEADDAAVDARAREARVEDKEFQAEERRKEDVEETAEKDERRVERRENRQEVLSALGETARAIFGVNEDKREARKAARRGEDQLEEPPALQPPPLPSKNRSLGPDPEEAAARGEEQSTLGPRRARRAQRLAGAPGSLLPQEGESARQARRREKRKDKLTELTGKKQGEDALPENVEAGESTPPEDTVEDQAKKKTGRRANPKALPKPVPPGGSEPLLVQALIKASAGDKSERADPKKVSAGGDVPSNVARPLPRRTGKQVEEQLDRDTATVNEELDRARQESKIALTPRELDEADEKFTRESEEQFDARDAATDRSIESLPERSDEQVNEQFGRDTDAVNRAVRRARQESDIELTPRELDQFQDRFEREGQELSDAVDRGDEAEDREIEELSALAEALQQQPQQAEQPEEVAEEPEEAIPVSELEAEQRAREAQQGQTKTSEQAAQRERERARIELAKQEEAERRRAASLADAIQGVQ